MEKRPRALQWSVQGLLTIVMCKAVLVRGCGGGLGSRGLKHRHENLVGLRVSAISASWVQRQHVPGSCGSAGHAKITDLKILQERDHVPKAKVRRN